MGERTISTENAVDTTLVTTDETVVATLSGISTSTSGRTVRLKGQVKITTGADTTAVNLRIRRDSLTGTEIEESNVVQVEAAAGSTEDHDIAGEDPVTGDIFNATYVLTAQQTGASANGTCIYAYLEAQTD